MSQRGRELMLCECPSGRGTLRRAYPETQHIYHGGREGLHHSPCFLKLGIVSWWLFKRSRNQRVLSIAWGEGRGSHLCIPGQVCNLLLSTMDKEENRANPNNTDADRSFWKSGRFLCLGKHGNSWQWAGSWKGALVPVRMLSLNNSVSYVVFFSRNEIY